MKKWVASLLLLTSLSVPSLAFSPADASPSGPGSDKVIAFAFQAASATPGQWNADWPVTPADVEKGFQPTENWSDTLRQFAVARFAEEAKTNPIIAAWLAEASPWAGTSMRFDVLPSVGYGNKYGDVSNVVSRDSSLTLLQLAAFLDTLSSVRKAEFIRQGMSFPWNKLTNEQRAALAPVIPASEISVNGTPLSHFPGTRATLSFQFDIIVTRKIDGKTQWLQTVFSHPFHRFSPFDKDE